MPNNRLLGPLKKSLAIISPEPSSHGPLKEALLLRLQDFRTESTTVPFFGRSVDDGRWVGILCDLSFQNWLRETIGTKVPASERMAGSEGMPSR